MKKLITLLFITLLINPQVYALGKKHQVPTVDPIPTATATASPTATPSPAATPTATAVPSGTPNLMPWYKTPYGVDLKACDGPIENQQTPWCTAFSFTGILENMLCDHSRLSIHHTWSFYQEYSVDSAAAKAIGHNITTWDQWPESANKPQSGYLNFAKHQITGMKYIDADDDIAEVFKVLDSGRPVYVGMALPADLASCYAVVRSTTKITGNGHALEVTGYTKKAGIPGGALITFKGSWGKDCGDSGYQDMPVSVFDLPGMYAEFYEPVAVQ